jgi:uncharacterized protein YdhG (YjbR/CyaY superfamily)
MQVENYINRQDPGRHEILRKIHNLIVKTNPKVTFHIEPMMGKEIISYKLEGFFIYGLASPKNHMSLHLMPIYCSKDLHAKYSKLLTEVKFQKGCINFKSADDIPLDLLENLLMDSALFDYISVMRKYKKS